MAYAVCGDIFICGDILFCFESHNLLCNVDVHTGATIVYKQRWRKQYNIAIYRLQNAKPYIQHTKTADLEYASSIADSTSR